uniref:Uncharacterized protein n=1 Tax=Triticum urartu TaxID=4572 RepID=A0A8R7TKP6_TRIUA
CVEGVSEGRESAPTSLSLAKRRGGPCRTPRAAEPTHGRWPAVVAERLEVGGAEEAVWEHRFADFLDEIMRFSLSLLLARQRCQCSEWHKRIVVRREDAEVWRDG